jgi:hypothetical protein
MVLFGNMETFMKSKKGGEMWTKYFDALKRNNSLFNGVPLHCEQHPDVSMLLKTPKDFDELCPDGGCAKPWYVWLFRLSNPSNLYSGAALSCGKHYCNRRCHRVQDHSKVECFERIDRTCARGHTSKVPCGDKSKSCRDCTKEDEENRRRIKRDLEIERNRQEQEDNYRKELQEIDDEISHLRRAAKYELEKKQQVNEVKQKKEKLDVLRQAKANKARLEASSDANKPPSNDPAPRFDALTSAAASEWKYMKEVEGARNTALDKLMEMIGLESVKDQLLSIKSTVDTKIRQRFSIGDERWSCSLLGNPGTGEFGFSSGDLRSWPLNTRLFIIIPQGLETNYPIACYFE